MACFFQMAIFHEVSKALNFNYKLNEPKRGFKFQGIFSDLQARLADIGVCHLFEDYNRVVKRDLETSIFISMDYYAFLVLSFSQKNIPEFLLL